MLSIPSTGRPKDEVFKQLEDFGRDDLDTKGGGTWAYVYDSGRPDVDEIAKQAYMMYLNQNGLDPTVYPSLMRLENELSALAASHLNGDEQVVGNFTSGGTESIILAVKTARDYARAGKPEIKEPEMVMPVTAHAAFHKAAHYLGIKKVLTPVDPGTFKADVKAMAEAVTPNTVLLVGSAVSYAHGVADPIVDMGELARSRDLLLHVDGCIGAFLLPYYRRLGADVPAFDFSVPGVTSMSMDWHKYAYCPKGASVVLYRNRDIRRHQLYACADWPGYTVINNSIQSSKSGGALAATWAVLNYIGDDGYLEIARRTYEATKRVKDGVNAMDGVRILGDPELCLVAFTSDSINLFHVIDEMKFRGWYVQPQLAYGNSPENIHLSVTSASLERAEAMLKDLGECVEAARALGPARGGDLAAELAAIDPNTLDDETFGQMLGMAGIGGEAGLPERMAEINGLLNAMPVKLRERLLIEFFNQMFVYE